MSDPRDLTASYDLGADFWSDFVRRFWGRRPTVIRQPFAHSIASPAEVYAAMVAATDRLRGDEHDFAFTIDGVRAGAHVERWLPARKDRSLDALAKRITSDLRGGSFAFFIRAFQLELGWVFWNRLRRFLTGLYAQVGVPAHRAEVDLFAGSYERSRRGIHLDSADVFCFVIEGRKRIRVWPGSTFRDGAYWYGLNAERKRLSRSHCLDGEPGDILYWPSSYWHVGESRGGTVSSLSLGLYSQDSLAATTARLVEQEVARELGADNVIGALPTSAEQMKAASPRALRTIQRVSANLPVTLLRRRLEQVTGYAFEHIPLPPARSQARTFKTVVVDPAFPILCRSVGGTAIVAANGRSITVPSSTALRGMIDALNGGVPVSLSQGTGPSDRHRREVVRFLLVSGALESSRER
jgi:50S ribosomal protein L16 3-hydroxylase